MSYIPKLACDLQSFTNIAEMNNHMNFHYVAIKEHLTKAIDVIFHLLKKYACRVVGVCWLKQESLARLAEVSVKTVERGMKFLKEHRVLKIYYTKRANGLNGNCYYVLQPFRGELAAGLEEIVAVEEANVGAGETAPDYETTHLVAGEDEDKLSLSSYKALQSSLKKEEEIIKNNARVAADDVGELSYWNEQLISCGFTRDEAETIFERGMDKSREVHPSIIRGAFSIAVIKWKKRVKYFEPILSPIEYMTKLVLSEIEIRKSKQRTSEKSVGQSEPKTQYDIRDILYNWLDV
jgi:hypothetical protein